MLLTGSTATVGQSCVAGGVHGRTILQPPVPSEVQGAAAPAGEDLGVAGAAATTTETTAATRRIAIHTRSDRLPVHLDPLMAFPPVDVPCVII
jgi:hypothetical protein